MADSHRVISKTTQKNEAWWHSIEIRQLRYFIAVAEELHFGRAAKRLRIAQPALSRQIAGLEADFGGLLFDRTHAQIRLTAAGAMLLPRARELLERLAEMANATRHTMQGGEGVLEIGFAGSAAFSILPDILKRYRAQYPKVNIVLRHMIRPELYHALINRRVQVGFTRPGIEDAEIVSEIVLREPLIIALPDDDPLAKRSSLELEELANRPCIMPNREIEDYLHVIFSRARFRPTAGQEAGDLQTALSLIAAGFGFALVPESTRNARYRGVAYCPLSAPSLFTEFSVSYRRDNTSEVLRAFCELVRRGGKKV